MATNAWEKFWLLLWKNWVIQSRHWIQTIFEVLLPVAFASLLIVIRAVLNPEIYDEPKYYKPQELNSLTDFVSRIQKPVDFSIAYSPQNDVLQQLVENARNIIKSEIPIRVEATKDDEQLKRHLITNDTLVGVQFPQSYASLTQLPASLDFTLRYPSELRTSGLFLEFANWFTNLMFPVFQVTGPRNPYSDDGGTPPGYWRESFLQIQSAISRAFIMDKSGLVNEEVPEIYLNRFPYPPYLFDPLLLALEFFVPLIILISFLYTGANVVKYIVVEKEKQLKEAMKIMGLANWLHWAAWFVKCFMFFAISVTLVTVIIKLEFKAESDVSVFTRSSWTFIWVYLLIYSVTTICFCFMLSVFFTKANTAAIISGFLWFISYTPYAITAQNYDNLELNTKYAISLFPNSAMSLGFKLMMRHEANGYGAQWNNVFERATQEDPFTVGDTIVMLLIDALLYLIVALYVEQVMPGEYGVPQPWYFPFTRSFWCKNRKVAITDDEDFIDYGNKSHNFEPEQKGMKAGIEIKNLRKVYSNKKTAVQGLSLKMYENQITVLLGHNGAGKTTTMSMLTGMIPPTSGTALIDGKDIRNNIDGVRDSLGLCPQHNILFDELTVKEHIVFFSRLKGLKGKAVDDEVNKYVNLLELQPKKNAQSKTLSGGQKRKLSVGVALCGGSKVVLCDEPTSGMDPSARRALWDLLAEEKEGRTLLLSTHFMDEADVLGDRIAIMAEGELRSVGSPFFLKKRYGVGYRLVCVKGSQCDTDGFTRNVLGKHIPDIKVETDIGTELSYILRDEYTSSFRSVLKDVEDQSSRYGITSYGVSLTTLEEVFLKVGSDSKAAETPETQSTYNMDLPTKESNGFKSTEYLENGGEQTLLTGAVLMQNQAFAMFLKKFYYQVRNWKTLLIINLLPVIFVIISFLQAQNFDEVDPIPLKMTLDTYAKATAVLENYYTTQEELNGKIAQNYQKMFTNAPPSQNLIEIKQDFSQYILKEGETKQVTIDNTYIVAATISKDNLTAWFNNQPYHAAPLTVNMLYNAVLKAYCSSCEISVTNHPLPISLQSREQQLQQGNNLGFAIATNVGFAFSFVLAFYVLFYVKERVTRSKLLQFVSGVKVFTYWGVSFIWDFISVVITILLFLATLVAYQEEGWATYNEIARVMLIMFLFAYSALPFVYLASNFFSIPSTGFIRLAIGFVLTGMFFFMAVFILEADLVGQKTVAEILDWVFPFFPHYALVRSLSNYNLIVSTQKTCDSVCESIVGCNAELLCELSKSCCNIASFYQWDYPGAGRNMFFLAFWGTIFFIVLFLKEYRVFDGLMYKGNVPTNIPETEDDQMDSDVRREKDRIKNLTPEEIPNYNLVLRDLTKFYKKFMAVNQLCVGVEGAECFGLLGVNGAGKTSTFKMITGDEDISAGEAWLLGISLKTNMNRAHQMIGYCPQFDALLDELTGRETLKIFALLRGIPQNQIPSVTMYLASQLNFVQHLDKVIKAYSGGNKRKLSTAIALLGNPAIVYLDEPTSGMDPGARRQLWNVITNTRKQGKAVILTSHSMEECEALCTRLAIMVNGEFKCLGSTQHLKNKFSEGFLLTLKLKRRRRESTRMSMTQSAMSTVSTRPVKQFVESNFPGAVLKEEHSDMLSYHIPQTNLRWSDMFGLMEDNKEKLLIEDYALGQTSLEQVFLFFTKYQRISDDPTPAGNSSAFKGLNLVT